MTTTLQQLLAASAHELRPQGRQPAGDAGDPPTATSPRTQGEGDDVMERLKRLADELTVVRGAIGNIGRSWSAEAMKVVEKAEAILRAAASETVGTEFPNVDPSCPDMIGVDVYNADLAAARVAVAEAKRERDEWKLASSKNGDAMSGYQSRAIVAEQRLEGAKRERDAALASLAEKRRAIDEAFATLDAGHGMLACREAAHILLPHATKANHSETPKSSPRPQCPPNATIKQGEPPFRNAVFGPGCSPHPLDANPVGSEGTPQVSPVGNDDTRELVARLAEAIARYFDDGEETVINLINRVRDIENAARRGGGA